VAGGGWWRWRWRWRHRVPLVYFFDGTHNRCRNRVTRRRYSADHHRVDDLGGGGVPAVEQPPRSCPIREEPSRPLPPACRFLSSSSPAFFRKFRTARPTEHKSGNMSSSSSTDSSSRTADGAFERHGFHVVASISIPGRGGRSDSAPFSLSLPFPSAPALRLPSSRRAPSFHLPRRRGYLRRI